MKKVLVVLGVLLVCAFSARLVASDTLPDPKLNSVDWYKCEVGRVKYTQGLEEKESKVSRKIYEVRNSSKIQNRNLFQFEQYTMKSLILAQDER